VEIFVTEDPKVIIAENIKKYLEIHNMNQKTLAEKINIKPSTVSDYLNYRSKPSHGIIQKIADVFGVHKSDIDTTYKDVESTLKSINPKEENALIQKYNKLDDRGKHTVNTVLDMEYNRVRKSHLEVIAAHNDDYSEEQIRLMQEDLDEL
jgi:transcriptional regulator with XRE-family HTH domain